MARIDDELRFTLRVLDGKRRLLGGLVDIRIESEATGAGMDFKGLDASKAIKIVAPAKVPPGEYKIVVTPRDGSASVSTLVRIGPEGPYKFSIQVHKQVASGAYSVHGTLTFDNGLPSAGITVRVFNIGFGGQGTKLGEARSEAKGEYAISYSHTDSTPVNLQVRTLDSNGKEIIVSTTKFNSGKSEMLNLVVPAAVQPLASEFQRLSTDMDKSIGGIGKLASAKEGTDRQDLTLLSQSTNWDARLVALAATAAQQTKTTGLGHDVLYGLFRVGLPSDPLLLATVPSATVQKALEKATTAGIVALSSKQISAATTEFQNFSSRTLLASTAPGAVSSFNELLAPNFQGSTDQKTAFANLFFSQNLNGADLWQQASNLKIAPAVIDNLKLQGKFLYLTFNNGPLAEKLQRQVGSLDNIAKTASSDYHRPDTWENAIKELAGSGGDAALQALIPTVYAGNTTVERLAAYTGDLARKIRKSFPTQVAARMIENNELGVQPKAAADVTSFLRAASSAGYSLGRTPLNRFVATSGSTLPALDDTAMQSVKTLHRLFQITPSTESLQAALKLGFTSAFDVASYSKEEFLNKYAYAFPTGEALIFYSQAQTVSSVTFNFFSMAKQLDNSAPVYVLSGSAADHQNAKQNIVQQFPSMARLFGNLDFCQCEDCRSVLSPAAYFVDVLDLLGTKSAPNPAGYTALDVLIGKDKTVPGRRPDLGALPLTCENTNTALPYIDLVNEILEYYIANSGLDANAAYDTGSATTDDLTAEPQHILPGVYNTTLKQAVYPLNLPFDLWIETVREFLNYFRIPLAQALDKLRPADTLDLFTTSVAAPYCRAQILAESLHISPAEYGVLTGFDPSNWFQLYGSYANEGAALSDLASAKTLSQKLGVSYQDLVDLMKTGFLNPGLYPLLFQFERFGIDLGRAFSFTNQPGYPALSAQDAADFGKLLDGITARYKKQNPASTFDARTWLSTVLPANYSKQVLVLADPGSGCDFSVTTLRYADGSAAAPLDFLKFNLFVRLWKKLGWTLDETDRSLQAFFPANLPAWTNPGFAAAFGAFWKTALVYLAHLDDLNTQFSPAGGRLALLPLWTSLPTQGESPLYAQLFVNSGVLNNDWAFDDPNGQFPWPVSDMPLAQGALPAHQIAVQGVLSLTAAEVTSILNDAGVVAPAAFTLGNLSICFRYSLLAQCLQIPVADMMALKAMSGLSPFQPLAAVPLNVIADDIVLNQTLAFVKQVEAVQNSGFTTEDLRYLLRHQSDPGGKYQTDPNAAIALIQSVSNGLRQIQSQNAVPPGLAGLPEGSIDQILSGLFPGTLLKSLFTQLTNSQTYSASQTPVAVAIDSAPFVQETGLTFSYDAVTQTQTVEFKGLLLDWKKAQLEQINATLLFGGLLDAVQQQAQTAVNKNIADILGVWSSLAQYEAVATGVPLANSIADPLRKLARADSALSFSYDQPGQIQWLGYRGVLTVAQRGILTGIDGSAILATLLAQVQQQALPQYNELIGSILAMWTNGQSYSAAQTPVFPANQIDGVAFATALTLAQQNGAIAGPVPAIQFGYDSASQTQTVTCAGVLTTSLQGQMAALLPSAVLSGLLQTVHDQAAQLFQNLGTNLLAPAANDVALYVEPFLGVDTAKQSKIAKAELVKVFLPLQAQKLSRQLVLRTLSAALASNASLTEALVTDSALLTDPANPGKSLLKAFLAADCQGVSATYFASANLTGPSQSGIAANADAADATFNVPGSGSCRFEGYLQVPTDGPYRFFAELGNLNSKVTLRLDSPDPAAILPDPAIQQTASKDGDEASQFAMLKGGLAYHFTLEFQGLGVKGASLLIQGETLPKGALSQILLLPQETVTGFTRARTLLSKVLQILQATGLDEREVSYLAAHASQFNNLRFSALPTQSSDDSLSKAVALFSQFLTLADYADLRKGPAGGTDGLVDVFQAATQSAPPTPPWTILANLTRRDPQVVQDVATALGPDPHFVNNTGIRRMWDALQLLQIVRLPVGALSASMAIVDAAPASPDVIAAAFKNAVKARYRSDQWRPIAKSVFDKLRQKKRDALVAYLVDNLHLENSNQLFEYFLVDPGMEPVVQTSRLRLAMSSVQTFVQRCLLNLENGNTTHPERNVAAGAIRADWWAWMKRYRVWQANREIFLFPENWMEPELRLDKTDLFQALESDLLQGDVTRDLVEDSFLAYLKGLDLRARLDIVATYLEQDMVTPGMSTLHVLGRTHGHPHKYFYRTYSSGVWSGWQAVTVDIESGHIVLAIWRGRLNIFWMTFVSRTANPQPATGHASGSVTGLSFDALSSAVFAGKPQKQVQIQLHWSELVQGKWSNRISTDVKKYEAINVFEDFDASGVHVHVSKETDSQGNEGAVRIHVDFPGLYDFIYELEVLFGALAGQDVSKFQRANHTFRVASKNCDPVFSSAYYEPPQTQPYNTPGVDATFYTGSTNLTATFQSNILTAGISTTEHENILNNTRNFSLLTCANTVAPLFLNPTEPLYWDAGGLVSPFFFKDTSNLNPGADASFRDERTFFVQPSLTETVIDEWFGWAVPVPKPPQTWVDPGILDQINVVAQVPVRVPVPINPGDPVNSVFPVKNQIDWATDPAVTISFGGVAIGHGGAVKTGVTTAVGQVGGISAVNGSLIGGHGVSLTQLPVKK